MLYDKTDAETISIRTANYDMHLEGETGPFSAMLSTSAGEAGIEYVHLRLHSDQRAVPPKLTLFWEHPEVDVHAHWNPLTEYRRGNDVNWGRLGGQEFRSKATSGAPVSC